VIERISPSLIGSMPSTPARNVPREAEAFAQHVRADLFRQSLECLVAEY